MSLDKRRFQRRHNLRQSVDSSSLMHHFHAIWESKYITLHNNLTSYSNTSYNVLGSRVRLSPIDLMYCVKAELVVTRTFAGTDSYTIDFNLGSNNYEYSSTDTATFENDTIDISEPLTDFFKDFREEDAYINVKVSNASTPLNLYGIYLRFTIYLEDSYGDYKNLASPILIDKSNINKNYIRDIDEQSKEFTYISGIQPR